MLLYSIFIASKEELGSIGDSNATGQLGPFGGAAYSIWTGGQAGEKLAHIISQIIGVLTIVGGIWFVIQFMIGAFKWITSGGDKNNVEAAKEHLTHSVISLAILVSAYIIAGLVGAIFGLDILNPQKIIPGLGPSGGGGMAPSIIAPPATGPGI